MGSITTCTLLQSPAMVLLDNKHKGHFPQTVSQVVPPLGWYFPILFQADLRHGTQRAKL